MQYPLTSLPRNLWESWSISDPGELVLFELGEADDLAAKIEFVFGHPQEMIGIIERGQEVYRKHKWSSGQLRFLSLVNRLLITSRRIFS